MVDRNQTENSALDLEDSRRGVSSQEIDTLKHVAVSVLTESLFKKILEINQVGCHFVSSNFRGGIRFDTMCR